VEVVDGRTSTELVCELMTITATNQHSTSLSRPTNSPSLHRSVFLARLKSINQSIISYLETENIELDIMGQARRRFTVGVMKEVCAPPHPAYGRLLKFDAQVRRFW